MAYGIAEYALPPETGHPFSRIYTLDLDGDADNDAQYHEAWAIVDGLGRTIRSYSEADPDPTLGDGFHWVVSGRVDYDRKGVVQRKYLPWASDEHPMTFPTGGAQPSDVPYSEANYDAFGRPIMTLGLNKKPSSKTRYHALSVDSYDAEDIAFDDHYDTFATTEKDGHGRVFLSTTG